MRFKLNHAETSVFQFLLVLCFAVSRPPLHADDESPAKPEEAPVETSNAAPPASEPEKALREGRYQEAVEGFRKELEKKPDSTTAARGAAFALAATGKYAEAVEALKSAKGLESSPDLLAAVGRIHLLRGALGEAEQALRATLKLDSAHVEALNRLGEALSKRGQAEEAKKHWEAIVEIYEAMDADDAEKLPAEAFVEMGLALIGLNRFKEANDVMFSTAKDKDAKNPAFLLESGRMFLAKYNYPDSRDYLKEALEENRSFADALVVLADNYLTDFQVGTKRYELAAKNLEEAIKVNPNHAGAYIVRGNLEWSDGNIEAAEADFRRAVELDPSSLRARGSLAACHYLEADEAAFKKAEEDALKVNPRGAELFHTIAMLIESKFRYKDCVRFSDKALELDPEYWPAYVTLGINCLRTGEEERGRKFLERSWEHDKYNVWVYNTRTLLSHMDKNYKELKTDRFVFKFPKKDYDELALYLVPLLEEAFDKLSAHYKTEIQKPVYIEVFSEHKWFSARTVGLEGFAASGACFGNFVTLTTPKALPQNWGAVAWHEFAHVVTLALTRHRVPRWLTEGLSVFEEGRDHPHWARGFEREIADQYASGRLLPIAQLDFGFSKPKYPNQILISYYQGCLIVEYVKEKWSWDAVLGILKGYGDNKSTAQIFREVLGQSLEEFDRGFFAYLERWIEANGYEPAIKEERVKQLEALVEADPDDVRKLVDLAWGYLCTGNEVDTAIKAGKALELDPENADAHAILGLDLLRQKKNASAKESLLKAIDKKTRFPFRVLSALGSIALKDGDKDGAIQFFEKARQASPRAGAGNPPGKNLYYQLFDLYSETGQEEKGIALMEELAKFAVEDPKCRQRIVNHYLEKEGEEAAKKCKQALEDLLFINPFDRKTHSTLARVAEKLSDHDVTIREYTYLLKFPDTNPKVAYLALAKAHASKGNKADAATYAKKVLALDEDSSEAQEVLKKVGAE